MFKRYDKDGDGFVTHEELKAFVNNCGVSLPDIEIEEMIKDADTNEDGKVTFEEYKAMMNKRWLFEMIRNIFSLLIYYILITILYKS